MRSIIYNTCKCFRLKPPRRCIHIHSIIQGLFGWSDSPMPVVQRRSLSAGWGLSKATTRRPPPRSLTVADTPSALDCTAGAEIAAIWSNSACNYDMYDNRSNSPPSPLGLVTFYGASHQQPAGIPFSLCLLMLPLHCGGGGVYFRSRR